MKLELSHTLHVAKLASLSLTNEEAQSMTAELGAILKHVEELAKVDVSTLTDAELQKSAASRVAGPSAWRRDEPGPCLSHEDALAQAPRQADGGFAVPKFVEGGQ